MASTTSGVSPFLSPPSILLLFLTFLCASSSTPPTEIPYIEHCNSIVPKFTPTRPLLDSESFQLSKGYFSGGGHLLESDSISGLSGLSKPFSFRFRAAHLHRTEIDGIIQVRGTLILRGGYTRTQRSYTDSTDGSLVRYNSTVRKEATFDLSGFWSKSSGKLCMVGRGSLNYAAGGSSLDLSAVLKLNYPEKSSITTSLVSGTVESLDATNNDATNNPNHFSSIQILAYAQKKYEYTMISQAGESCSRHTSGEESLEIDSNSYCPRLRRLARQFFRLGYGSECSGPNCGPFGTSHDVFMSLNLIHCAEEGKLHFYLGFSNVSRHRPFVPEKSLVGEGFWDSNGNRLCVMACRILNIQGDTLATASVGDCTIGFSLWFPEVLSINSSSSTIGHTWSNKGVSDTGYFDKVSFSSFDDDIGLFPGLKYEYTKLDTVKNLCEVNEVAKLEERSYPDGRSLDDMEFNLHVTNSSDGKINAWGRATLISVGGMLYQNADRRRHATLVSDDDETYYEHIHYFVRATKPARTLEKTEQIHWNVSYKISYTFQDSTLDEYATTEITAEGIYNSKTGMLCMVGCKNPSYSFAKKQGKGANNAMDCEILINIHIPSLAPGIEERRNGTIKSTREKSDPLFFDPVEVFLYTFFGRDETVWRMDIEIIMVRYTMPRRKRLADVQIQFSQTETGTSSAQQPEGNRSVSHRSDGSPSISAHQPQDDIIPSESVHHDPSMDHPDDEPIIDDIQIQDGSGRLRRRRGSTLVRDVWQLPEGERIVIECNKLGQPIKKVASLLTSFLGTVARRGQLCPLNYSKWNDMLPAYKIEMLRVVQSKFVLPSDSSDFVLKSLNHKWKEYRAKLKRDYKLEGRTEEQVVATCPPDVHPHQWMELVHYWFSERAQTYSDIGRAARAAQSVPHTAGSKSYARLRHEFADQQGREPGEMEFYRMTHVHQDGSFVRDESRDIYNRATSMITERAGEGSSSTQSSRIEAEVFSELMGPERPGRVRGYGIGVTPTQLSEVRRYTRDTRESHDQLHVRQLQEEIAELRQTRDADRAEMQTIRSQLEHVTSVLHMFMSSQVPGASASRRPDDDQPPTDQ